MKDLAEADRRPDPDALLRAVRASEARSARGRLKVFLGMCPGVGKTYAMLQEAARVRAEGVTVVAGIVETHGRPETAALLAGLPVLPPRVVVHRGTELREFDLEAALRPAASLVMVDELAHENAPGSTHPKRWMDVVDLVEAGIDVFTTLNVQHIESRAEAVRQITGVLVRETVPDSLLDLADEVELVDLTAEGLRERLLEGKVYHGAAAVAAAGNFFREENLHALRELALRYTAERVDRRLRALRSGSARSSVWRSGERLLVAVGPSPFSTQLVRWTRRLAGAQGAAWVAVHVASSRALTAEAQVLLDRNLALARELGAETVMTRGEDVARALVRVALEHNATQIVVGKPRGRRWLEWLHGGGIVDRLLRLGGNIDIYVVPAEPGAPRPPWVEFVPLTRSGLREYVVAAAVVLGLGGLSLLVPERYYLASGLMHLMAVVLLSLRVGRGPVLLAGMLGAVVWNFLSIPPRFSFAIGRPEDALLFLAHIVSAVVVGQFAARLRAVASSEHARERRATALLHFTRALSEARTLDDGTFAALRQIDALVGARSCLLVAGEGNAEPVPHFAGSFTLDERERAAALWTHAHRRPSGRFTDTLPGGVGHYLPLVREGRSLGVLGVAVESGAALTLDQRDLLAAFADQLALLLEREHLRAAQERDRLLSESERLHRALLDSVSHELRTPLAVITAAVDNLAAQPDEALRAELLREARLSTGRLNRVVENLLDQTRLETGALRARMDWCDARDVVNAALEAAGDLLAGHPIEVVFPSELGPVRADFALLEQALFNLFANVAAHTPRGTAVTVGADEDERRVRLFVADRGPGVPSALRERLFQKFARGEGARAGGLGLGLSIVRGFLEAQGGTVVVGDNPGGGAVFSLYLSKQQREASRSP